MGDERLDDEPRGGSGILTMSAARQCWLDQTTGVEEMETKRVLGGDGRGVGTHNHHLPPRAINSPPQATRVLDVSDLADRLAHVRVSTNSSSSSPHLGADDPGRRRDASDPIAEPCPEIRARAQQERAGAVPIKGIEGKVALEVRGDEQHVDELLEHTESTHDETLSVADRCHPETSGDEEAGSGEGDASVMTGSRGSGNASHHLRQPWHHHRPLRHQHESGHAEDTDEHESNGTSCFSLDAMVGHSSCESSVTWYEGSQIDEVTVDDDHHDESHEDVLLSSRDDDDEAEEIKSNINDVIVYDDDETMFEWTSTESFFEDSAADRVTTDNELEQEGASSSSSSCTSPLSSSPPPLPLAVSTRLEP